MKRRIVKQGSATMTISLPSKWIKKFNLDAGDEINLEEKESAIEISAEAKEEIKKKEIDVSALDPETTQKAISALYRRGYDEITVKFGSTNLITAIQNTVDQQSIGFEIIKQGKDFCIIKDLGKIQQEEFDNALRRSFLLLKTLATESLEAIKKNDKNALSNIAYIDANINKFTNFCERVLAKKGYKEFEKTPFYYHFSEELEELADEFKSICDYYLKENKKISKKDLELYEEIISLIGEYADLFYKFNLVQINELFRKLKQLKSEIKIDSKLSHHLTEIVDLMTASLGTYLSVHL